MPIQITPITEQDIPGAITCIQRAFEDDPYNHWVFDKKKFSYKRNSVSLGIRCRWGMKHAIFTVAKDSEDTSNKVIGVACWLRPRDPTAPQTWSEWAGDWWLWLSQVRMNAFHGRGGLNVKRYYIWKKTQAEAQDELWRDPNGYYFCNIVTVLPEAQGKGVGKLLFKDVTDVADREGRKCYLESSRAEPNMAIYERMGFELKKEMVCDDNGDAITLYCMTREPKPVATT
jgi:GNAT superfamily N-acetyltransferase